MPLSKYLLRKYVRNSHADCCQTGVAISCERNEDGYLTVKTIQRIRVGRGQDLVHKLAWSRPVMCIYVFGPLKKGTRKLHLTNILCYAFFFFFKIKNLSLTCKTQSATNSNFSAHFLIWETMGQNALFQFHYTDVRKNEGKKNPPEAFILFHHHCGILLTYLRIIFFFIVD